MSKNIGLLLTEEQEKALERAYSGELLNVVLEYLNTRESSFNPWIDLQGNWLNQTDKNGNPIEDEAAGRLLSDAAGNRRKLNSTYRFTPFDKVRFTLTNHNINVWELMKYLIKGELAAVEEVTQDKILVGELDATCNLFDYVSKTMKG